MTYLFIDTSDKDVSIGIIKDGIILSQKTESIPNKHSVYTTSYLKQVLDNANITPENIDKILITTGPGSFTGIRIGLTIAKVYAYLLKKDIIPVSSLKILALSTSQDNCYLALIDAKHDNYYMGLYDKDYNEIVEPKFTNIEEVKKIIKKYNPKIISNNEIVINDNKVEKTTLNLVKIVDYYKNKKEENVHLIKPNYLKLPEALEKNDKRN